MIKGSVKKMAPFGIAVGLAGMVWSVAGFSGGSNQALALTTRDPVAAGAKISTRKIPGLGQVLVNGKGFTLYVFKPDNQKKVTCTSAECTAMWPPVVLKNGNKPAATGAVKTSMLGSDPDPAASGERVATYNNWPLYTYKADTRPGQARGQTINLNGGLWYVISPSGKVIKTKQKH